MMSEPNWKLSANIIRCPYCGQEVTQRHESTPQVEQQDEVDNESASLPPATVDCNVKYFLPGMYNSMHESFLEDTDRYVLESAYNNIQCELAALETKNARLRKALKAFVAAEREWLRDGAPQDGYDDPLSDAYKQACEALEEPAK